MERALVCASLVKDFDQIRADRRRRGGPVRLPDGRKLAIANELGVLVVDLRIRMRDAEVVTLSAARSATPF